MNTNLNNLTVIPDVRGGEISRRFCAYLSTSEFRQDIWENKPALIIEGDKHGNRPIHYALDLIRFLSDKNISNGSIRIARSGPKPVGWRDLSSVLQEHASILEAHEQGDTVVVNDIQAFVPWLGELCKTIEATFNYPVNANCYWTPHGNQGLAVHFDLESVFVIQLEGKKTWKVFRPQQQWPDRDSMVDEELLGNALVDCSLAPGDILYIPRGCPHFAKAEREDSLHVTIAISPITWRSFFHHLVDQVSNRDPRFRTCLPIGFMMNEASIYSGTALWECLMEKPDTAASAATSFINKCFDLPYYSATAGILTRTDIEIGLNDTLSRRMSCVATATQVEDRVILRSYGVRIEAPAWLYDEFKILTTADRVAVRSLSHKLSDESKVILAKLLVEHGAFEPEKGDASPC